MREENTEPMLIPTILCGGAGSRLWPVSREQHPKPFIKLNDGMSLLQKAFHRGAILENVKDVLTVTNRELFFRTEDEYRQINEQLNQPVNISFILEPFGRNTAPAIASACLLVEEEFGDDAIMLILPADHLISNQASFADAVQRACELAKQDRLVTFGIKPTSPEAGYGYIESQGHDVVRFVEKPSTEVAREYVSSGNFLWNSGMFCFCVKTMIRELREHCPEILESTKHCLQQARKATGDAFFHVELGPSDFEAVPDDSIDYCIMEKTRTAAVIACDIGWSDIGCWRTLGDLTSPDQNNNRIQGSALVQDSNNCTIKSEDRIVGLVGVNNLIIVDTADALLVAEKNRSQEVKHIYTQLKELGHEAHKIHRTVHRPWGTYTVLENGQHFKIKRIEVKPGRSLSLQLHNHRSEHWVVVKGKARVFNGSDTFPLDTNESTYIPATHKHRLENTGADPLVIIEVQTGSYLGEDDIIRFQDAYGRAS